MTLRCGARIGGYVAPGTGNVGCVALGTLVVSL